MLKVKELILNELTLKASLKKLTEKGENGDPDINQIIYKIIPKLGNFYSLSMNNIS